MHRMLTHSVLVIFYILFLFSFESITPGIYKMSKVCSGFDGRLLTARVWFVDLLLQMLAAFTSVLLSILNSPLIESNK